MKLNNNYRQFICLTGLLLVAFITYAQTTPVDEPVAPAYQITLATIIYMFAFLMLVIAIAVWQMARQIKALMSLEFKDVVLEKKPTRWSKFFQIRSSSTDKDHMINHPHDGIYELDNPAPPWFMFLFYVTIGIAVIYYVRFTFTKYGYTQVEEYEEEMLAAKGSQATKLVEAGNIVDEENVQYLTDATSLNKGKTIYDGNCKLCHGEFGEGKIGPNFTDDYFLHGGSINDVFKIIKYGVVEKGMVPWGSQLGPEGMQLVASYVKSLQGTKLTVKGKPAQGELYIEPANSEKTETAADKAKSN